MKARKTLLAGAAAVAMAPLATANAQDTYEGIYGAIGAGLSYMALDRDFQAQNAFDSTIDYENGIGVYTALGYAFGNDWRSEVEFSYRQNDTRFVSPSSGFGGFTTNFTDEVKSYTIMANVLRDIQTGTFVTPYVGVGVGGAIIDTSYRGMNAGGSMINLDDRDPTLAYQGIAGLSIELAENLALDLSYRYLGTLRQTLIGTFDGATTTFRQEYDNHSAFAGLRWNFGAAAPVVQYQDCWDGSSVPTTSQCPPQLVESAAVALDPINFVVYFDYDKSNLTPQASTLVREAAARALEGDIDTVVVSGNTDTSGSSAYNQALSQRRAAAVRAALIDSGVPADRIETRAFGETNLAKATPDGTREPLNRRSEVTISFE
ncbi:MAG: OmpA family protein [Pseudomonadota bacterium]